ncbi:uncharacterized protein LOC129318888 isoform X2 [Prosopis cineraria]|nr:uncharacterized protein LOC129318888 isoform X2 [Prosopis cineraria]
MELEELHINSCGELQSLIAYSSFGEEIVDVDNEKSYGLLFPKLKSLKIQGCDKLKMVSSFLPGDLPKLEDLDVWDCKNLKYIIGEYRDMDQVSLQETMLPSLITVSLGRLPSFLSIFEKCNKCMPRPLEVLKEDSKNKDESSGKRSAFSWVHGCCFGAPIKDTNIVVYDATLKPSTISQEFCASSKRTEMFHTECLMRQPLNLQNIRQMTLSRCSKLKSLFSVSIATTIMLEQLFIYDCKELKHIITNEVEGDGYPSCNSNFPKLQWLTIWACNKLEFIFPCTFFGGLQKLKSINVDTAHELKYVFGKCHEECLSNENENKELHIDVLALETLYLHDVPNMRSICINNYQMECTSQQIMEAPKEIKEHMEDVTSEAAKESKVQEIVNVDRPLIPSVGTQYFLNFRNLKEITVRINKKLKISVLCLHMQKPITVVQDMKKHMKDVTSEGVKKYEIQEIVKVDRPVPTAGFQCFLKDIRIYSCKKLKALFSVSACRSLPQLSVLVIGRCEELVNVVEEDFNGHHQMNYSSTFPKLEHLKI